MKITFSPTTESPQRIPSLDGLRAISISLVLVGHAVPSLHLPLSPSILALFSVGGLGVKIFFVISGFLITSILLHEYTTFGQINLVNFYFRRVLRIFPAYYFFLAVLLVLNNNQRLNISTQNFLCAISYTTNYCQSGTWNTGHTWSLAVEEQFYLIWPATLLLAGSRKSMYIASILLIICPLARLGYLIMPVTNSYAHFETVADSLAVGCLLAGIHKRLESHSAYMRWLQSPIFLVSPLMVLLLELLATRPSVLPSWIYVTVGMSVQNILICMCVHYCILNARSRVGRLLNTKLAVFIGVLSYSIYLWQQIFLNPYSQLVNFPLSIALIMFTSLFSYFMIEQPFLRLRKFVLARQLSYQR